jgi:sensor domain DACNV-containing protein
MDRFFSADHPSIVRIHEQLEHLVALEQPTPGPGRSLETITPDQLAMFIEVAFWASLRTNEGRPTQFSATLIRKHDHPTAIAFAEAIPFEEEQIAKVAPALPPGGTLVVSVAGGRFDIWGFGRGRETEMWTVSLDVSEPGVIRVGAGPYQPFAVLDGRLDPIISDTRTRLPHYLQGKLKKTSPTNDIIETQAVWHESIALGDLARVILAEGHGGTLLIVPDDSGLWEASLDPFAYRLAKPDTTIRDGIRQQLLTAQARAQATGEVSKLDIPDEMKNLLMKSLPAVQWDIVNIVRPTAALAAVDGAVVVTQDLRVLGFGAKIAAGNVTSVNVFLPLQGSQDIVATPVERCGGTRHQSAARFVNANREAVAVVMSQDRHLSVFSWDDMMDAVVMVRRAEWWV